MNDDKLFSLQVESALTFHIRCELENIKEGKRKCAVTKGEIHEWADEFYCTFKQIYPRVTLDRKKSVKEFTESCYSWVNKVCQELLVEEQKKTEI